MAAEMSFWAANCLLGSGAGSVDFSFLRRPENEQMSLFVWSPMTTRCKGHPPSPGSDTEKMCDRNHVLWAGEKAYSFSPKVQEVWALS